MEYLQLACPYCAGQFSAAAAVESRTTACPHCDREVTVPAAAPLAPPAPPESPAQPPPPAAEHNGDAAQPPRRLSPEERAKLRRRFNVVVAVLGMTILAIALMVLLRIRP